MRTIVWLSNALFFINNKSFKGKVDSMVALELNAYGTPLSQ